MVRLNTANTIRVCGPRVRELRKREGITQVALAKALSKSQAYVSSIETMTASDVPMPTLARLAGILGVPFIALLENVDGHPGVLTIELADALTILDSTSLTSSRQRLLAEIIQAFVRDSAPSNVRE